MDPNWIQTVGLPTASLVAIGYGFWTASQWMATHLVLPLRDRHFEFLDSMSKTLKTIADTQEAMAAEIGAIARATMPKDPPSKA